ncbi:unnamed protein product [Alopecurus aequalis]
MPRNVPVEGNEEDSVAGTHGDVDMEITLGESSVHTPRAEGLGYTSKDMANFRSTLRADNKWTDMHDTRSYLEKCKETDPDFFYKYKVDEEDRVVNIYWVDGAARKAYKKYNDCVSFHTTYMTNTYKMSCAPFIGINNYEQSIQFALYDKRKYWVPAYFMHNFFPFLQTTQRSEGFNAVLKKYVNPFNSVLEFVKQFAEIQAKIMKAQNKVEADSTLTTPSKFCYHPIEHQVSKVYTRNIHVRFQFEMQNMYSYNIKQTGEKTFLAKCITKYVPNYYNRAYEVYADPTNEEYRCTCCKFERDGIVCCHILRTMAQIGITKLPDAYILRRWTWSAEDDLVEETPGKPSMMPEESRQMMKLALYCAEFKNLTIQGNQSQDGRRVLDTHLKSIRKDLADLKREQLKRVKKSATAAKAHATASSPPTTPTGPHPTSNTTARAPPRRASSGPQSGIKRPRSKAAAKPTTQNSEPDTTAPSTQADSESLQAAILHDPRISNTKGRKKKQAFQNPLNINRKEIRTCKQCGSESHDYKTCPERGELPEANNT